MQDRLGRHPAAMFGGILPFSQDLDFSQQLKRLQWLVRLACFLYLLVAPVPLAAMGIILMRSDHPSGLLGGAIAPIVLSMVLGAATLLGPVVIRHIAERPYAKLTRFAFEFEIEADSKSFSSLWTRMQGERFENEQEEKAILAAEADLKEVA